MKEHLESDIPFIGPVSLTGFADVIANKIIKLSGVDLFKNSRKREYVEYRGLLCYILRDKMQMNLQSITDFFKSKKKDMHHATVLYLLKMYPIYKINNQLLCDIEKKFIFNSIIPYDEEDKINYLENKYKLLEKQHQELIQKSSHPIVKFSLTIDGDKVDVMLKQMKIIKQSWNWKEKNYESK